MVYHVPVRGKTTNQLYNRERNRRSSTARAWFKASSPTSCIPRGAEAVNRAADVILREDVHLSVFRLHDSPDFTGRNGVDASQPEYYEVQSFFPDKSFTLTAQSNNPISGLTLETSGPQVSYFRADRNVYNEMSLAKSLIENLAIPDLGHQAENKGYVDNRFIAYTPTEKINLQFEAIYSKKNQIYKRRTSACLHCSGTCRKQPSLIHSHS
jgi:hypothetical protein